MNQKFTKKEKTETCVVCGTTENLTRDHIIPKWFTSGMKYFGIRVRVSLIPEINTLRRKHDNGANRFQTMCGKCNNNKSGIIDYSNPQVRAYVRYFIDTIREILDEHEK